MITHKDKLKKIRRDTRQRLMGLKRTMRKRKVYRKHLTEAEK